LRAALLEAAGRIVEKAGPAGLSVREAARRAGVSHNAPYRHFPDREAMLAALADEGLERLDSALKDLAPAQMARAYVGFATGNPQRFRLMFAGRRQPRLEARFSAAYADLGPLAGVAAWALVHGLALLLVDGHLQGDEAFVAKVLGAVRLAQRPA
jgi:AcrR family transcriptional regulator